MKTYFWITSSDRPSSFRLRIHIFYPIQLSSIQSFVNTPLTKKFALGHASFSVRQPYHILLHKVNWEEILWFQPAFFRIWSVTLQDFFYSAFIILGIIWISFVAQFVSEIWPLDEANLRTISRNAFYGQRCNHNIEPRGASRFWPKACCCHWISLAG